MKLGKWIMNHILWFYFISYDILFYSFYFIFIFSGFEKYFKFLEFYIIFIVCRAMFHLKTKKNLSEVQSVNFLCNCMIIYLIYSVSNKLFEITVDLRLCLICTYAWTVQWLLYYMRSLLPTMMNVYSLPTWSLITWEFAQIHCYLFSILKILKCYQQHSITFCRKHCAYTTHIRTLYIQSRHFTFDQTDFIGFLPLVHALFSRYYLFVFVIF